jgi:sulfite exporter TauE/SafE
MPPVTLELWFLLGTAATVGFIHTILGPDHYIPFVAMAKARNWSNRRAMAITALSGIGHVLSSIIIGAIGLFFGIEVLRLGELESVRGNVAGWLLLGFGIAYMIWGIRHAAKKRSSLTHSHGSITHTHPGHETDSNITPWVIFTIFVLGPCEPLIPVLMYPAARADAFSVFAVAMTFSLFTVGTMLALVYASLRGLAFLPQKKMERYSHALAGFVIAVCGAGIQFLGL